MQNLVATIQCSNPHCLAFNKIESQVCQSCNTPIVKRYLRVLGNEIKNYKPGQLIGDRYLLKEGGVVLDTRPAIAPEVTEEVPDDILPYLQLFPSRLHIPQIYGLVFGEDEEPDQLMWLLEYGTVPTDNSGELKSPQLLTKLTDAWPEATDLRKLNWLWQIARLWQPLASKNVVSSLLNEDLLRVNGPLIQLLELQQDRDLEVNSLQLVKLWMEWSAQSSDNIQEFLQDIYEKIETGKIHNSEELVRIIDRGIETAAKNQNYTYQIFTVTDSGPSRSHNEDACYPPSGRETEQRTGKSLAIVCDGIGGHASGEVASQLAIESILDDIKKINLSSQELNEIKISLELEKFVCNANDVISDRNDSEQRQERQRMGTTLAMTLGLAHQMYLTYVGDSRIYWITNSGCYPVSVDDDLASREVQLGYAFYRDALQYPNAGALVQALGMESSANLRPSVERTIVDEDCIFLLCSDGLSDYDRVEQYWKTKITPILDGELDLATAGAELLEIANQQNGHDNVTIALVHCQVSCNPDSEDKISSWSSISKPVSDTISSPAPKNVKTQSSLFSIFKKPAFAVITGSMVLLALGLYNRFPNFPQIIKQNRTPSSSIGQGASIDSRYTLEVGDAIEIEEEIGLGFDLPPTDSKFTETVIKTVPKGSILQVVADRTATESSQLILKVCHLPDFSDTAERAEVALLQEGELGKIETAELKRKNLKNIPIYPHLSAKCSQNISISDSLSK